MARILGFVADLVRGAVRCMFPLACVAVLGGLVWSDQGRDVLVALIEFADGAEHGHSIAGLLFLGAGCALLGLSAWYSMRWLLLAELPALPLPDPPGWGQRWLPRLVGALPLAMAAVGLWTRGSGHESVAQAWAIGFGAAAALLLAAFAWRGDLLLALARRGWIASLQGREGADPGRLRAGDATPALTLRVIVWSIVLTLVVGAMMLLFRVTLPRVIGAAAVAALALASINLFGSFVLTYWPLRRNLPPLAVWALLAAALLGAWNDNHEVATLSRSGAPERPPLKQDFEAFLTGAKTPPEGGVPTVLFVASEGGGIRAAYWTAAVLQELASKAPELFAHNLYALSGVSGGSLGVAAWVMSRRAAYCPQAAGESASARSQAERPLATTPLGADFVSPAVAGIFYYDLLQRFLPFPVPAFDRSRTMEDAWQRAFSHLPGEPFAKPMDALYAGCPALPRLLLNATVVETGQRAVLAPFAADEQADRDCHKDALFLNALPAMSSDLATRQQPLAGLVHHSARFPVVSPAGTVTRTPGRPDCARAFRLVDGGYFDNSGAETVMDLVLRLQKDFPGRFRPLVLLVRNAASPLCEQQVDEDVAPGRIAPEIGSVIGALAGARGSHAVAARAALARSDIRIVDVAVQQDMKAANAPLGWALSDRVRADLDAAARSVAADAVQRFPTGDNGCGKKAP
ncbi:MAG: hypothetical protein U1F50_07760 [Rubrivivax sp.]